MDCPGPLRWWKLVANAYIVSVGNKQKHVARKSQRVQQHAMGGRPQGGAPAPDTAILSSLVPFQRAIPTHDPRASDGKNLGCKLRSDMDFKDLCDGFDGRRFQLLHRTRKCVGTESNSVDIVFFHTEAMAAVVGVGVPFGVVQVPLAQGSKSCAGMRSQTITVVEWREEDWKKLWQLDPEAHSQAQDFTSLVIDLEESDQSATVPVQAGGQQVGITIDVVTSLIQSQSCGAGRGCQDLQNEVVEQEQSTGASGSSADSTAGVTGGTDIACADATSSSSAVAATCDLRSPDGSVTPEDTTSTVDVVNQVTESGPATLPSKQVKVEVKLLNASKMESFDLSPELKALLQVGLVDDGQPQPQPQQSTKPKHWYSPPKFMQCLAMPWTSTSAQAPANLTASDILPAGTSTSTSTESLDRQALHEIVFDCCIVPELTITFTGNTKHGEILVRVGGDFQLKREHEKKHPRVGYGCAHDHLAVLFAGAALGSEGGDKVHPLIKTGEDCARVDPDLVYVPEHTTSQASSTTEDVSRNTGIGFEAAVGPVKATTGTSRTKNKGNTTSQGEEVTGRPSKPQLKGSNFIVSGRSTGDAQLDFIANNKPKIEDLMGEEFDDCNSELDNRRLAVFAKFQAYGLDKNKKIQTYNACGSSESSPSDNFAEYKLKLTRDMYIRTSPDAGSGLSKFSQQFEKKLLVNHAVPLAPITSTDGTSANGECELLWVPRFEDDDSTKNSDVRSYVREAISGEDAERLRKRQKAQAQAPGGNR